MAFKHTINKLPSKEADGFEVLDGAGFEAAALSDVSMEVAGEVDAFTGFAVAGEDAFGFGLDATGVVNELAAVAVTGEAFNGVDL